ncbi:hypothetical protein BpHYR1_029336 [Brachionus plicatilis]|uniref:Uncharacterized protein n=1 Tax=Brachionus plicatilis TaxID=10195 RepID=A0A3M7Q0T0_BRAPC|nr:hypothetical protein BpHYR1_029336 [Brachionus plicatilis]
MFLFHFFLRHLTLLHLIKLVVSDSIVEQLSSLENKLSSLLTKLDQKNEKKFELIDCTDLKNKLNATTISLVTNNFSIIKKYLESNRLVFS